MVKDMSEIRSHRDLVAWQKAMELASDVMQFTKSLPVEERFGLVSQLRRACVSVPSNIAEGYGRGTTADYIRFLRTARGSLYEIDTQALLCVRFAYVSQSTYDAILERVNECGRILAALIRSLEDRNA
ncbi:four helix bundle protein [Phycisphaerae bacterium]|nr:four helix bundle protein [Phycisphaerae bacterium]